MKNKKVFLGGTTAKGTNWRNELIPQLKLAYFNPMVADWTPACQAEEIVQRKTCDFVLYVITKEMEGFYAIAEVVDDSNKRSKKTIFCYLADGFTPHQLKSLKSVEVMVKENGVQCFTSLEEVANYLNTHSETNFVEQMLVQTK